RAMQLVMDAQGPAELLELARQSSCFAQAAERLETLDQVFEDVVPMVRIADPREVVMRPPRPPERLLIVAERERTLLACGPGVALELQVGEPVGAGSRLACRGGVLAAVGTGDQRAGVGRTAA